MCELIYENPLANQSDTADWIMEGQAKVSFENSKMRMESVLDPTHGQAANFVYWCNIKMPDNIKITWDFKPLSEEGLAILFFSANGKDCKDLFDAALSKRSGLYAQYHSGDINAFHVSYYRRSETDEMELNVANLRKSSGFHLVAQGADPIPAAKYTSNEPYHLTLIKTTDNVTFIVNGIEIFRYTEDFKTYGGGLTDGYIGFRQKTPLIGEYSNLKVYKIK